MDQQTIQRENSRISIKLKSIKSSFRVTSWESQRRKEEQLLKTLCAYPHQFRSNKKSRNLKFRKRAFNTVSRTRKNIDIYDNDSIGSTHRNFQSVSPPKTS